MGEGVTHLTQPLSKCEKIVEMGKKFNFSKTQPTKPSYKSMNKKQQLFKTVLQIFLNIPGDID